MGIFSIAICYIIYIMLNYKITVKLCKSPIAEFPSPTIFK